MSAASREGGADAVEAGESLLHATAVSHCGRALLLTGPSGSGKSGLALRMMALGAGLIADDRTRLVLRDGRVLAACPPALRGRIEARGVGILAVEPAPPAPVALVVDLGTVETARLPPTRHTMLLGERLRLLHKVETPHFPAALLLYLAGGITEEDSLLT